MSDRSFRFLYSNFRTRSNLSALFERRETHRVAPKRFRWLRDRTSFSKGRGKRSRGLVPKSRQTYARNYSKLASRSIWRFGPRLEDLLYRRFIIDRWGRLDAVYRRRGYSTYWISSVECVYYFAFILLSWLGKCLQIFRETKQAMSSEYGRI